MSISNAGKWTVFFVILLIVIFLFFTIFMPQKLVLNRNDIKILFILVVMVIIGVLGNIKFKYVESYTFIITDIIDFLKFPLTFVLLKILQFDKLFAESYLKVGNKIVKLVVCLMFICGLISQVVNIGMTPNGRVWHGIKAYSFLFSHPTYYVATCIFILGLLISENKQKNTIFEIILIISTLLGLRTKGLIVIVMYLVIKIFHKFFKEHRLIFGSSSLLIAYLVGKIKLQEYMAFSNSARESAYRESMQIIGNHFPFGSGFASFGSYLSGTAGSTIYARYPIVEGFNQFGYPTALLGDTGYPYYIAQFGFIGVILFVYLLFLIYKSLVEVNFNIASIVIFLYLIVALTSESSLLNYGVEAAVVLATVNSISNKIYLKGKIEI